MYPNNLSELKKAIDEIHTLIGKILQDNFLTDKTYTQITAKIGLIDDYLARNAAQENDANYVHWSNAQLSTLSQVLIEIQSRADKSATMRNEDLMHPTGDYYNEDNSIMLSAEAKNNLQKLFEEEFVQNKPQ